MPTRTRRRCTPLVVEHLADEVARMRRHVTLNADRIDRHSRQLEVSLVRMAQVQDQIDRLEKRARDLDTCCAALERRYNRLVFRRAKN